MDLHNVKNAERRSFFPSTSRIINCKSIVDEFVNKSINRSVRP